ncbi:MAG: hypothetical protein A2Y62_19095 [Candidatus Fischerbacteria bacterium RBG_13_37_8]|uniref:Zinc-finger domain-containing protein n=1 Tax=Candidatus Fischerbacteria bacterium RBG_13_37_8 TaxID=1817863 RepID=A0A1F5VR47_9BACT|nr:MAG: hypothetical protein A2Y62_19095 [Candidatus Fischerbacteria bacterium RBG_13_37_8]
MKEKIHKFTENDILRYIDNELGAWKKYKLIRHLKTCSTCSQLLQEYKLIEDELRNKPSTHSLPSFKDTLLNKIQSIEPIKEERKSPYSLGFKLSFSGALIITIFMLTLHLFNITPEHIMNALQFIALYRSPSTYIQIRQAIEEYYALYATFKSFINYGLLGIITAWGLFYIHRIRQ